MPRIDEERLVYFDGQPIKYYFTRKKVKNINLRIYGDGNVAVSAPKQTPAAKVDHFVIEKGAYILRKLEVYRIRRENAPPRQYHSLEECVQIFTSSMQRMLPLLSAYNVPMPTLSIREMKNSWGVCTASEGLVTLSVRLVDYPQDCIDLVVMHELCHFVHLNHSKQFYALLTEVMPDWEERKKRLFNGGKDPCA